MTAVRIIWTVFDHAGSEIDGHIGVAEVADVSYELAAADALARFFAEELGSDLARLRSGTVQCTTPGEGERPGRILMNWERDPMAEVSDGWLSNIAASGANLAADLEWEPRYCAQVLTTFACPSCAQAMARRKGRFGSFLTCEHCGLRMGAHTKKAKAAERVKGFCGTALRLHFNHLGVPYAGCDSCGEHLDERKSISELFGSRPS